MSEQCLPEDRKKLHSKIRGGLIARGTSFAAWCKERGVKPPNAYQAVMGVWVGPKASALVEELKQAAGVSE